MISKSRECLRDGRLARRMIINDGVREVIRAVLDALQRSNPSKVQELLIHARDPAKLKEIVNKPQVLNFINELTEQPILSK